MPATILVIDDNPEVAEIFCVCLHLCGMKTRVARSLQEAYDICSKEQIDAMLVDFILPDGKGPEILVRLREKCPKVRLLISGYNLSPKQYPGFDDYLQKPVDCRQVCSYISERVKS